jgi:hypothetical protein
MSIRSVPYPLVQLERSKNCRSCNRKTFQRKKKDDNLPFFLGSFLAETFPGQRDRYHFPLAPYLFIMKKLEYKVEYFLLLPNLRLNICHAIWAPVRGQMWSTIIFQFMVVWQQANSNPLRIGKVLEPFC